MARSYMFGDRTTENRRKMREEQQVELRQQKKEEALSKKRVFSMTTSHASSLTAMREKLCSNDLEQVHQGVYEFRSLLSVEDSPPIQPVIDSGCVPRFVQLLDLSYLTSAPMALNGRSLSNMQREFPDFNVVTEVANKIRVEAAWVITNIASGTTQQTRTILEAGAIPFLVQMLLDPSDVVIDQSVWALGNIAGDSEEMRDTILDTGALDIIISLLMRMHESTAHTKIVRNLTWLLSNLNRGRNPPPRYESMRASLGILFRLIETRDPEIVSDAFWALSYIADIDLGCTDLILASNAIGKGYILLEAFTNRLNSRAYDPEEAKICSYAISPLIRMLGNIATGTDEQTNHLIRMGILQFFEPIFYRFENKKQPRLRKEMCWTLSNITAGTLEQVQAVFDARLIPLLTDAMLSCEPFIRKEACWAVSNLLFHCDKKKEWLDALMDNRLIDALQSYLEVVPNIPEMQCQILDCFRYALEAGRKWMPKIGRNAVLDRIIELDLIDTIEGLQESLDRSVADKAYALIIDYFTEDED
jgi:importin subunit alpha-6/7